jgi:hypothetical protein
MSLTIAFDGVSGSVLCKADGGGKYHSMEMLRGLEGSRKFERGAIETFSRDPPARIAPFYMKGKQPFSMLLRRVQLERGLEIDSDYESRQLRGDFLPISIRDLSGNSVFTTLCMLETMTKEQLMDDDAGGGGTRGAEQPLVDPHELRRGIRKYWRNSVEFVRPHHPPLARFVLIDAVPGDVLQRASRAGSHIDIRLTLRGVVFYRRFTSLAWSVDAVEEYAAAPDEEGFDSGGDTEDDDESARAEEVYTEEARDRAPDAEEGDRDRAPDAEEGDRDRAPDAEEGDRDRAPDAEERAPEGEEARDFAPDSSIDDDIAIIRDSLMRRRQKVLRQMENEDLTDEEFDALQRVLKSIKRRLHMLR